MHPRLHTPVCDLLCVRHPIVQAPMAGGWTTPALVSAVTNAGGLGSIPAARTTVDGLRGFIDGVKAATDGPFAVNFLLAPPDPAPADIDAMQDLLDELRSELGLPPGPRRLALPAPAMEAQLELALATGAPVISFAMGRPPGDWIERAHQAGAKVLVMVTSAAEAVAAETAGADALVAQGIEAGGHRATFDPGDGRDLPRVGTLALVPQVVDAVAVPVIAAGGIMDARGLVAALALGAGAAQMGTRFLLSPESGATPAAREWMAGRPETETTITRFLTGRPCRVVRSPLFETLESSGLDPLPWPWQALAAEDIYQALAERGEPDRMVLLAGQGLRLAGPETGAAEIVERLVREAGALLDTLVT